MSGKIPSHIEKYSSLTHPNKLEGPTPAPMGRSCFRDKFTCRNTRDNSTTQISPSPGPIPATVGSNHTDVNSNITVPKSPQIPVENTTKVDQNDTGVAAAAGGVNQEGIDEKCSATSNKCTTDQKDMIACLLPIGLQEFFLLVQNEGESKLEVNISVSASVNADLKELKIPKYRANG